MSPEQLAESTPYSCEEWQAAADRLGDQRDQLWATLIDLAEVVGTPTACAELLMRALTQPVVKPLRKTGP